VPNKQTEFINHLQESFAEKTFLKLTLSNYHGIEPDWKNIYVRQVLIKNILQLSFTFRRKTNDFVKNFSIEEGLQKIFHFIENDFKVVTLFTTKNDIVLEQNKQNLNLKVLKPSTKSEVSLEHNKEKQRIIKTDSKGGYLYDLKITDIDGNVFKNAQDKYKQINHYVEILSSLIKEIPIEKLKKVADMGSGKGYLTFALYDYLKNTLGINTEVVGVEYREDLVKLCNQIAQNTHFEGLKFTRGTIENYESDNINLLIALHACDTATDDAIAKGIKANADLIVVAPCCHKQIRREMEKNKAKNEVDFLVKYGVFLERQAEMVTDGIRALILEYFGYKTKVFEFISDAHTPKNVMIVGIKSEHKTIKNPEVLAKIEASKQYFGIEYHHLERIMLL
jgi:SAM-dependent methyltransferase